MTTDDIIKALGGPKVVAGALGVSRTAPYNWRDQGIPAHHWPDLVALAVAMRVTGVTFDALRETGRHAGKRYRGVVTYADNTRGVDSRARRRKFATVAAE